MSHLIDHLEPFMLRDLYENNMSTKETIKNSSLEKKTTIKDVFFPKYKDKLFWCYYILRYGKTHYENINIHPFKIEKKIKEECIALLNDNKTKLKERRLKYEINDLLCEPYISLNMFFALCCASCINVVLVRDKTYYKMIDNTEETINYIYQDNNYGYGIKKNPPCDLTKTHLEAISLLKPVRAISAYKLPEIENMCSILDIKLHDSHGKRITKNELYNKIKMCIL